MGRAARLVLLTALAFGTARAQDAGDLPPDGDVAAYCLGANRLLAERFRRMQLWACGRGPAMAWCRDAKATAPRATLDRERLAMRFARYLDEKGLLDADQPEIRRKVTQRVEDGSGDAAACFNEKGERDEAACDRLQRCENAEKIDGL